MTNFSSFHVLYRDWVHIIPQIWNQGKNRNKILSRISENFSQNRVISNLKEINRSQIWFSKRDNVSKYSKYFSNDDVFQNWWHSWSSRLTNGSKGFCLSNVSVSDYEDRFGFSFRSFLSHFLFWLKDFVSLMTLNLAHSKKKVYPNKRRLCFSFLVSVQKMYKLKFQTFICLQQ